MSTANTEIVTVQSVVIARDCKIARDVIVMDTDHYPLLGRGLVSGPVEIWRSGVDRSMRECVTIRHDSLVGAAGVVTKSVAPGSVIVLSPTQVLRTIDPDPQKNFG